MPNPLSSRGFSDRDYAALVGTLAGEAAVRGNLRDYQAIADVIANRVASGDFGTSVAGVTMDSGQFSAWSPREQGAYRNAMAGFAASLNPQRAAAVSPEIRSRIELAQQAANDVFNTGVARGVTQGATFYDNPEVTARLGTDAFHNRLNNQYGGMMIGDHRFTGPSFRPDQPFDPITYNGQLAAPPAAETFFGDLGAPPTGNVSFMGGVPDLTPAPSGFSLDGATLPDNFSLDFGALNSPQPQEQKFDFSQITAGTAFDQIPGFSVSQPAQVTTSDVALNTYPDITAGVFDKAPSMTQNTFNDVFDAGFPQSFGPSINEMGQPQGAGFAAGVDAGPWGQTPDFNAPSLEQRNAETLTRDRINAFESGLWSKPGSVPQDQINASVMTELAPKAPSYSPQPIQAAPSMPTGQAPVPMGDLAPADVFAPPQAQPQTRSLPTTTAPVQQQDTFSLGTLTNPIGAVKSALGFGQPDASFMNAMSSPQYASSYSPGFLDTAVGRALTGAASGALFGGLPGAVGGGIMGGTGWGNAMSNQLSDFFGGMLDHAMQGWDSYDFSTHGYGPGFNARGERSPTTRDESGGATLGDGSYAEGSGRNDNNPQGIY